MSIILLSSSLPREIKNRISSIPGCEAVYLPVCGRLPEPTGSHPDMLVFSCGSRLVTERDYYFENKPLFDLLGREIVLSGRRLGREYPGDVLFNAFESGGILYGKLSSLAPEVTEAFAEGKRCDVRQGYAKCSTVLLPDGSAMTADKGIAAALEKNGADVLTVAPGGIDLPGYDTGFIGGGSFVFGDGLYFFGDPQTHPSGGDMVSFAEKHGCRTAALGTGKLGDHGGAVVL